MNSERGPMPEKLRERLERLVFRFEEPRVLIIISNDFGKEEGQILLDKGYRVIEVQSVEDARSKRVSGLLLQAQAIQKGLGDSTRPDLPKRLALIIPIEVHNEAMLDENLDFGGVERYREIYRREHAYATIVDDRPN